MIRGTRYAGGGGGAGEAERGKGGGNPLALVLLVLWLLTLVVAPIVSRILAMAVSRKREYLADATGAQFTRNPLALASALEKLEAAASPTRAITRGAAHLCIVDPAPGLLLRAGRLLRRRAGLPPADPPAYFPAAGHGVSAAPRRRRRSGAPPVP